MAKISTRNITAENVEDIMSTAAYGITYWATEPRRSEWSDYVTGDGKRHTSRAAADQHAAAVQQRTGQIIAIEAVEPKDGVHTVVEEDGRTVFRLTPAKIRQAVVEVAEGKHTNSTIAGYVQDAFRNWTAADGIDCGDIDADAADCIVQVACFGEVVYG